MMRKKDVLLKLIDQNKAAVLDILLNAREEMVLKEISVQSKVPMASTFRILQELVRVELVSRREWKTSILYLKQNNEQTKFVEELFEEEYDGIPDFMEGVKDMPMIQSVILHGGKKKNKANILLIGDSIDSVKVELVCAPIRERGFDISYVPLGKDQYAQMSRMGLYGGEKVVLK